jgi:hypothetical protein
MDGEVAPADQAPCGAVEVVAGLRPRVNRWFLSELVWRPSPEGCTVDPRFSRNWPPRHGGLRWYREPGVRPMTRGPRGRAGGCRRVGSDAAPRPGIVRLDAGGGPCGAAATGGLPTGIRGPCQAGFPDRTGLDTGAACVIARHERGRDGRAYPNPGSVSRFLCGSHTAIRS